MYYNTTNEIEQLELFTEKAKTQNELILNFFKRNPTKDFTADEVHIELNMDCPITSVRRSLSDLSLDKQWNVLPELKKCTNPAIKRLGRFGRNCYAYKLI